MMGPTDGGNPITMSPLMLNIGWLTLPVYLRPTAHFSGAGAVSPVLMPGGCPEMMGPLWVAPCLLTVL
jgi:hypothetical protein